MNPVRECNAPARGDQQQMEVDTEPQYEPLPSGCCAFSNQDLMSYVLAMTQGCDEITEMCAEPSKEPDEPDTTQATEAADEEGKGGNVTKTDTAHELAEKDVDFDVNDDFDCVTTDIDQADAGTGVRAFHAI